jgi:tetratricopeptide (TPR) repeat protein
VLARQVLKDHRGAIADFSKAIELNSRLCKPYLNRGNARELLNDRTRVIVNYSKAIEKCPEYEEAYFCRRMAKIILR